MEISKYSRYELIKGVIQEISPSDKMHGFISAKICTMVSNFVREYKLEIVTGAETGYKLTSNHDTVRASDIAFESNERLKESGIKRR